MVEAAEAAAGGGGGEAHGVGAGAVRGHGHVLQHADPATRINTPLVFSRNQKKRKTCMRYTDSTNWEEGRKVNKNLAIWVRIQG